MKSIKDMDIDNKKVIIRCDFNVPIKDGKIIDDTRIKASLKTITYCLEHNAKIVLLSHLGRVKEEADLKKNDLAPVAIRLSELLNKKVLFIPKTRGKEVEEAMINDSKKVMQELSRLSAQIENKHINEKMENEIRLQTNIIQKIKTRRGKWKN